MLFKKDRKIRNLEAKVKNRDRLIKDQELLIVTLVGIIDSLEDDNKCLREESFENAKKSLKKKTKKN